MMKTNIQTDQEDRIEMQLKKAGALCTLSITKVSKKSLNLKMQTPIGQIYTVPSESEREEEIKNKNKMI